MKKKIKVLHIVSSYDNSEGGPPISINNIAFSLRNTKELENNLITSTTKKIKINNFKNVYIGKLLFKKFYIPSLTLILKIKSEIQKNQIIHIHNFWNITIFIGLFLSIFYKKKIILSPHGSFDFYNMKKSNIKKKFYLFFFGKYQISKIHYFHFLTEQEKKNSFYLKKKDYLVLSNYSKKIKNIPKLYLNKKYINFCYLGRLDKIKNLAYQIQLINKLIKKNINARLTIIGPDYGEKEKLIKLINNLNLKNYITFKKPIYTKKKYSWLKYSDFVLLTSHYECNSVLALETLACGGCLITNNSTNLKYLKNYNVTQYIDNNVTKSSNKIKKLFKNKRLMIKQRKDSLKFTKKYNEINFRNKIKKFYLNII